MWKKNIKDVPDYIFQLIVGGDENIIIRRMHNALSLKPSSHFPALKACLCNSR